jgi:AraC-like DNA-binding protein
MRVGGYGVESIDGRIETRTLERLKLSRIVASPHRLSSVSDARGDEQHAVVKVMLQLRGSSVFEQDATRVYVNAGDCLAYDVSRPHIVLSPSLSEHLVVVIPQDLAASYDLHLADIGSQRFAAQRGIGHVTRELVEASLDGVDAGASEQMADLLLRSLRLSLQQAGSRSHLTPRASLLRRAKTYIDEHLGDPALDIERVVAALACSKRYLQLAFAEEGTTASEYLWASRLERCRREIVKAGGTASLTELAFAAGFSSSSHFSRSFKRRYGQSPSAMLGAQRRTFHDC